MDKPQKKIVTEDKYIDRAEDALDIKYPQVLRDKLKSRNGFSWGFFENFYCVLDDEDKFYTFNDVIYENTNRIAGWNQFIPKGYVAIADDGAGYALLLSTSKDGKVYHYNNDTGEVTVFAENDKELTDKLDSQEEELRKIREEDEEKEDSLRA